MKNSRKTLFKISWSECASNVIWRWCILCKFQQQISILLGFYVHCAKSPLYTFEALAYNRYDDVLLNVEVSCHVIPFHRVDHVLLHYYNHILCKICLLHLMWDELLVFYGCIHEICWECDGKRHREGVVLWEINKIGFYVLKMIIKVNLLSQKARSYYAIHVLKP